MSHEKPPDLPPNVIKLEDYKKKRKKKERISAQGPPYDVEEVERHLRLVEKERTNNLANLSSDKYEEMRYLQFEINRKKEIWRALAEFAKKVKVIGKTNDDMVKISSLKSLTKELLAGIFLSSDPDKWKREPLFYTELYRVIGERLKPKPEKNE